MGVGIINRLHASVCDIFVFLCSRTRHLVEQKKRMVGRARFCKEKARVVARWATSYGLFSPSARGLPCEAQRFCLG